MREETQQTKDRGCYNFVLELDFEPFNASFPRPSLSKSIGNGVQFLNRHLSSKLFHDRESLYPLLNFLRAHNYKGMTMMLNDRIRSLSALQAALRKSEEHLATIPVDTPYSEFPHRLQMISFRIKFFNSLKVGDLFTEEEERRRVLKKGSVQLSKKKKRGFTFVFLLTSSLIFKFDGSGEKEQLRTDAVTRHHILSFPSLCVPLSGAESQRQI